MTDLRSKGIINSMIERAMEEVIKKGTPQERAIPEERIEEKKPEKKTVAEEEKRAIEEEKEEEETEDVEKLYEASFQAIKEGKTINGTVSHIEKEGVFVYVGGKSEGFIPLNELSNKPFSKIEDITKIGDEIRVMILNTEDKQGHILLSRKRVETDETWAKIAHAYEKQEIISAKVTGLVKGGLTVDVGVRGFVPASQVSLSKRVDLNRYKGQTLSLRVIEFNRKKENVVLSQRVILEEEAKRKREELWEGLVEGKTCHGKVVRNTQFGAFVNLGGLDGLIPMSELSWRRIKHASDVVKVGQEVDVLILKVDKEKQRVSLSLRQIQEDPWKGFTDRFQIDQVVEGRVSNIAKSYLFVELIEGIEGIVPASEISSKRGVEPSEIVSPGQKTRVKILNINPGERKVLLSIKRVTQEEEKQTVNKYLKDQTEGTKMTLGDIMKEKFGTGLTERMDFKKEE